VTEDKEKYAKFWELYGTNIKYGVAHDSANRQRLSKLLRYHSTQTKEKTSFDEYVSRMKPDQTNIYYLAGESKDDLAKSPLIEKLVAKGIEVILMTDPIDEWSLQNLPRFDNKYSLVNVAKEGFKIEGDDSELDKIKTKEQTTEFKPLFDFLKKSLKGRIARAVISQNLVKTPSAITSGSFGFTANMERLMKAQTFADQKQLAFMKSQRILEINPNHPLIKELNKRVIADPKDPLAIDTAELLYETASLHSGFSIDNPVQFSSRILRMMKLSLNVDFEEGVDEHVLANDDVKSTKTTTAETEKATATATDTEAPKDEL